jgi:hypothetical protein
MKHSILECVSVSVVRKKKASPLADPLERSQRLRIVLYKDPTRSGAFMYLKMEAQPASET